VVTSFPWLTVLWAVPMIGAGLVMLLPAAQRALARDITARTHGEAAAAQAEADSEALFSGARRKVLPVRWTSIVKETPCGAHASTAVDTMEARPAGPYIVLSDLRPS